MFFSGKPEIKNFDCPMLIESDVVGLVSGNGPKHENQ
jgi:hypothetical protein